MEDLFDWALLNFVENVVYAYQKVPPRVFPEKV